MTSLPNTINSLEVGSDNNSDSDDTEYQDRSNENGKRKVVKDNKRNHMKKKLSAHQRDMLYLDIA